MKICRFSKDGNVKIGIVEGEEIWVCNTELQKTDELWYLGEVRILAPVQPSKIVCVGRNYADHAAELGNDVPKEPLLFLKAPSAIIADGDAICIPPQSNQAEHEGELAVVIGHLCKSLSDEDDPLKYVLGYACLNDVTARDIQRNDVQFTRGKSFDTFCPIGPYIETELNLTDISIKTRVNGMVRQDSRTSQMVFPVDFLIRYISNMMTLLPGDVIATGTPSGVSTLRDGDICEVEIQGLGTLHNPVTQASLSSQIR